MKMKRLGRTDMMVSELCLGTMTWGVQNDREDAFAQLGWSADCSLTAGQFQELIANAVPGGLAKRGQAGAEGVAGDGEATCAGAA